MPNPYAFAPACLVPALLACASIQPAYASKPVFDGEWSVQWCDKTDPRADCGGFNLSLAQNGDRLCGTYDGARARLSQIDEGDARAIHGAVVGNVAILTIESARSGDIYLVRASVQGDVLRWRMLDTVKDVDGDIDIIAYDDTLRRNSRRASVSERRTEVVRGCAAPSAAK
jgi:hypothetical protein